MDLIKLGRRDMRDICCDYPKLKMVKAKISQY
jgi:hypothetical protein